MNVLSQIVLAILAAIAAGYCIREWYIARRYNVPQVGQIIWVPDYNLQIEFIHAHASGGRARIATVKRVKRDGKLDWIITIQGFKSEFITFSWNGLCQQQNALQQEFRDQAAAELPGPRFLVAEAAIG